MSNALAIAAVTAALRNLLDAVQADFPGTVVTTQPPNIARTATTSNQLNIFLYHTMPNVGWRNLDMPNVRPGETGQPPLALDLFYLLTVFGSGDDDIDAHQILGRAISILHDHAVLNPTLIRDALVGNNLHEQVERIRISPEPISMDDLFKMWSTFQTEYRISVAYKVTVILIESQRPIRTPLPVLAPNLTVQGSLIPPFPTISAITLPNEAPSLRLGETFTLHGYHLSGDAVQIRFTTPRLDEPITLTPDTGATDTDIQATLPNNSAAQTTWPVGVYQMTVRVTIDSRIRVTNTVPLLLAPRLTALTPNPLPLAGGTTLTVTTQPNIRVEQETQLLLGSQPLMPQAITDSTLTFDLSDIAPGAYFIRLRVDGVDSHVVDYSTDPPVFNPAMRLEVTA